MRLERDGDFTDLIHGFLRNGNGDQEIKLLADITEGIFSTAVHKKKFKICS